MPIHNVLQSIPKYCSFHGNSNVEHHTSSCKNKQNKQQQTNKQKLSSMVSVKCAEKIQVLHFRLLIVIYISYLTHNEKAIFKV